LLYISPTRGFRGDPIFPAEEELQLMIVSPLHQIKPSDGAKLELGQRIELSIAIKAKEHGAGLKE
jgi:hypothetical protein